MTNIFVGNLPYGVTEAELTDCFGQYGVVEKASLIRDRDTGQSRGFAFVEMTHLREAMLAIQELNGCDWDGRIIQVSVARERQHLPRPVRTEQTA